MPIVSGACLKYSRFWVDQRHEPELTAVVGLRLDKDVAPDTHFSGSSDEPPPFVNIEFHQTFVSHFQ